MRVLHVVPWLAERYGGPVVQVPQAARALSRAGHHVEIVTTNVDGTGTLDVPIGSAIDWDGTAATFHAVSAPRWYLTSWSMLADLDRRVNQFDVVHIHCLYRFHGVAAAIAARRHSVPYVIQPRGTLDAWHRRQRRRAKTVYHALVEDRVINGASAMICTSRREATAVRELGYRLPIWIVPNGVDVESLRARAGASDFDDVFPPHGQVVTFLGRLSAKKGIPVLVDAFRAIAGEFPDVQLVIAGPDDEGLGRSIRARVGPSMADRVKLIGVVGGAAKRGLLQRSSVFVLPSADESFGNAAVEAMAVGCPVIVSPEVAISDVVREEAAGIVAERDAADIAAALRLILKDRNGAAAMGDAGRRAVESRYQWTSVAETMTSMYEAVGGPTPAAEARSGNHDGATQWKCPRCRSELRWSTNGPSCVRCAWKGIVTDGIPVLLAKRLTGVEEEDHRHVHKAMQAAHFDPAGDDEFETTRPHRTPALYRFLLDEKFRRATRPIGRRLRGATALAVCGGSGMDAEFLVRAGAAVTTSDISTGSARRARSRAARHGIVFDTIVADVDRLPYGDRSVDLVAVHDGLHHLPNPYSGLAEMARVARRWIIVSEPARAVVTRVAIRLRLALEIEEAGNRVERLEPRAVADFLRDRGFEVIKAERYAMYYPHRPGRVFAILSAPVLFHLFRAAWSLANAVIGRFGNKMVVVAERKAGPTAGDFV